jgi:HAD domain in Swiss Army Knife RNA repair proteins
VLIFLDFDGVLRRRNAPLYRFEKPLLAAFEAAVRHIPGAEIVVTSSWREVVGLTGLRKLFSADVAERIVGVTPFAPGGRYREILAYLQQNEAGGRQWVVVDDDPVSYPRGGPIILVDPMRGFGASEAERLAEMANAYRDCRPSGPE